MAWNDTVATLHKGAYITFDGVRLRGVGGVQFALVGSVPEIDINTQETTYAEFKGGIPDAGNWTMDGKIGIHSPVFAKLKESANAGAGVGERTLRIVYGARSGNAKITDGKGTKVNTAITISNAFSSGTHTATISAANAAGLNAFEEGFYLVKTGADTPALKITGITETATGNSAGSVVITTDAATDPSSSLGTSVDIVLPASGGQVQAYVNNFTYSGAVNGIVDAQISFRATGEPTEEVGTPNITL